MKKGFKQNVLNLVILLVSVFAIGIFNVDAVSIRETTSMIEDGTYVIGITKFRPGQVITMSDTATATMDYMTYISNQANPMAFEMYYYDLGDWYYVGAKNTTTMITDSTKIAELNNIGLNIFYVDNVEKYLQIPYTGSTTDIGFRTDKANKDRLVYLENGTINVPATVSSLAVLNGNTPVATYAKANESDEGFIENPNVGRIISKDTLLSLADDDTLVFQGRVPYKITRSEDTPNGNFVSVAIIADRVPTDKENTKIVVYDGANMEEGTEYTWGANNTDLERDIDVLFTEEVRTAAIQITWEEGNTQVLYVGLTDTSMLDSMPGGSIDIDVDNLVDGVIIGRVPGEDFRFVQDSADITRLNGSGLVEYYDSLNGLSAGNRIGVAITPNAKYSNSVKIEVTGNADDDEAQPTWKNGKIVYTPKLTEKHTTEGNPILINVTWEEGFTQTFTIDASGAILTSN